MHAGMLYVIMFGMTCMLVRQLPSDQNHSLNRKSPAWVNCDVCTSGGKFDTILQLWGSGKSSDIHADLCVEPQLPNRQCVDHGTIPNTGTPCELSAMTSVIAVAWCTLELPAVQLTA